MKRESALAKYARSLTSSGHNYKINTELFGTIDTKKLVKELALEQRGNEDGKNNLPSARSSAPTAAEASIKEQIDSAKKYAHTLAEDNIYTYNERISSRNFDKQITETKKLSSEAIMEFRADVNKCVADMHEKRRDLKDIENELNVFRNRNGLRDRTAYMPSTPWQILKILIILILVIIETAFNGVYLAEGNEQGLLGGTTYAVSIAIINIGFACILSFFGVKHLFHVNFLKKLFGLFSLILLISIAFIINISLAHIREIGASADNFGELGNQVLQRLQTAPFSFNDIKSWILFGIGILFASVAALDFLYFNDLYPGYTSRQKKLDKRRKSYNSKYKQSIEFIEDLKGEHIDSFKRISDDFTSGFQELEMIMSRRKSLETKYKVHHKELQSASDELYAIYRDANLAARKSKSRPSRFNKKVPVLEMELSNLDMDTKKKGIIEKKVEASKKDLIKLIKVIETEFLQGMKDFRNIDTLVLEKDPSENVAKKTS